MEWSWSYATAGTPLSAGFLQQQQQQQQQPEDQAAIAAALHRPRRSNSIAGVLGEKSKRARFAGHLRTLSAGSRTKATRLSVDHQDPTHQSSLRLNAGAAADFTTVASGEGTHLQSNPAALHQCYGDPLDCAASYATAPTVPTSAEQGTAPGAAVPHSGPAQLAPPPHIGPVSLASIPLRRSVATSAAHVIATAARRTTGTTRPGDSQSVAPDHHQRHQHHQHHQSQSRDRMPASEVNRYYHNKQLPATPRLDTRTPTASTSLHTPFEPTSARSPASAVSSVSVLPAVGLAGGSSGGGDGAAGTLCPSGNTTTAVAAALQEGRLPPQHAVTHFDGPHLSTAYLSKTATPAVAGSGATAASSSRTESVGSLSAMTTLSGRTMQSTDPAGCSCTNPPSSAAQHHPSCSAASSEWRRKLFVVRNGRTFIADPTLPYPLPVDLAELHRQSLRTLLLFQLFGGPVCSPAFAHHPPQRVLDVGCGAGFWSMMCYRYYRARHGNTGIQFTGMDIAPLAPCANVPALTSCSNKRGSNSSAGAGNTATTSAGDGRPDKEMNWRYVQHDMRRYPWPFADEEFDLVMLKDLSLTTQRDDAQGRIDQALRILAPGGTIEIWESDHHIRLLRPHVQKAAQTRAAGVGGSATRRKASVPQAEDTTGSDGSSEGAGDDKHNGEEEEEDSLSSSSSSSSSSSAAAAAATGSSDVNDVHAAAKLGAYVLTGHTPFSAPLNNYLVEYNTWLARALEARALSPVPCTLIGASLLQECDTLTGVRSRRLAVPLSEVRWEREGVGGVVTKTDGKSYIETNKGHQADAESAGRGPVSEGLQPAQRALRRTALLTVVQMVQSLEPVLREVSGKSQDEWDSWLGKMMNDLVNENGTHWGECLEVGAWWARKRSRGTGGGG